MGTKIQIRCLVRRKSIVVARYQDSLENPQRRHFRKNVNDQSGHSMPRFLGDTEKNKMNTSVTCTLVEIDHEWDNKIQSFDFDIYHMSGWIKSSALIDQGEPKGLIITLNEKPCCFLSLFVD